MQTPSTTPPPTEPGQPPPPLPAYVNTGRIANPTPPYVPEPAGDLQAHTINDILDLLTDARRVIVNLRTRVSNLEAQVATLLPPPPAP